MSTQKPMVGITGDFRPERYNGAALTWFNTGYYDSVTAAGGIPVLLPPLENDDDLNRMMENISGVVVSGCNLDLDPTRLKMHLHPSVKVMPKRREDFDRRVAEMAIKRRLPILAIGSGMQLVNALCGGTLYQHIPEEVPRHCIIAIRSNRTCDMFWRLFREVESMRSTVPVKCVSTARIIWP